jgi:hypothetical protein
MMTIWNRLNLKFKRKMHKRLTHRDSVTLKRSTVPCCGKDKTTKLAFLLNLSILNYIVKVRLHFEGRHFRIFQRDQ